MMSQLTIAQLCVGLDRLVDRLRSDAPDVAEVVANLAPLLLEILKRTEHDRHSNDDGVAAIATTDGGEVTLSVFLDARWEVTFNVGTTKHRIDTFANGTVRAFEVGRAQLSLEAQS